MHLGSYLELLHDSEEQLAEAFAYVAERQTTEPDVRQTCILLAKWSRAHVRAITPIMNRYLDEGAAPSEQLRGAFFKGYRPAGFGLVRDLHDLWVLANQVHMCWHVLNQAAQALDDDEMAAACRALSRETTRQLSWIRTRISVSAPQALIAA